MSKYLRHGLFWLFIYLMWSYMKSGGTFFPFIFLINLLNVGIYMVAYYTLTQVQLPLLYNKGKKVEFVLSIIAMSIVLYLIWRLACIYWIDPILYPRMYSPWWTWPSYLTQTVQFYSPAIALLAWENYHDRQKELVRIEVLEKEKLATELKFLKAQINPHFLFNTLNNLYSFVVNQSPKAPDLIMQLSGMLDYVLYQSQKPSVALSEEIDCIEDFIELEKIRYGDRLKVDFEATGALTLPVSPLILLSLVENAFKHGASGDIDNPAIQIKISTQSNQIFCDVWNTKSQFEGELNDAYKEGIGLSNIKRQLKLIYPESHDLVIRDEADYFQIQLTINTEV